MKSRVEARSSTHGIDVEVRAATIDDIGLLLSFIRAMARYERLEVSATEEDLRESFFGERPAAFPLLASVEGRPVGYAVFFFTFATTIGKRGLWLDDLYVCRDFRRKGVGAALFAYLAGLAARSGCDRFEWMVLDWNESALGFYRRMGAEILKDWRICRLSGPRLADRAGRTVDGPH